MCTTVGEFNTAPLPFWGKRVSPSLLAFVVPWMRPAWQISQYVWLAIDHRNAALGIEKAFCMIPAFRHLHYAIQRSARSCSSSTADRRRFHAGKRHHSNWPYWGAPYFWRSSRLTCNTLTSFSPASPPKGADALARRIPSISLRTADGSRLVSVAHFAAMPPSS